MYKIVGADRREYGPISRETVLEWIAQGRANAQTIARFEDGAWRPLRTFVEFKAALGVPESAPPPVEGEVAPILMPPISGAEAPAFSGVGSIRKTNVPAILGIVFPFLGFCCCCPIGPITGLILAIVGYTQIRSQRNIYSTPIAVPIIGIVLSAIFLGLQVLGIIFDSQLEKMLQPFLQSIR